VACTSRASYSSGQYSEQNVEYKLDVTSKPEDVSKVDKTIGLTRMRSTHPLCKHVVYAVNLFESAVDLLTSHHLSKIVRDSFPSATMAAKEGDSRSADPAHAPPRS